MSLSHQERECPSKFNTKPEHHQVLAPKMLRRTSASSHTANVPKHMSHQDAACPQQMLPAHNSCCKCHAPDKVLHQTFTERAPTKFHIKLSHRQMVPPISHEDCATAKAWCDTCCGHATLSCNSFLEKTCCRNGSAPHVMSAILAHIPPQIRSFLSFLGGVGNLVSLSCGSCLRQSAAFVAFHAFHLGTGEVAEHVAVSEEKAGEFL